MKAKKEMLDLTTVKVGDKLLYNGRSEEKYLGRFKKGLVEVIENDGSYVAPRLKQGEVKWWVENRGAEKHLSVLSNKSCAEEKQP